MIPINVMLVIAATGFWLTIAAYLTAALTAIDAPSVHERETVRIIRIVAQMFSLMTCLIVWIVGMIYFY